MMGGYIRNTCVDVYIKCVVYYKQYIMMGGYIRNTCVDVYIKCCRYTISSTL